MPQIYFYHLTTTPLERALPKLLEKAIGAKFKVLLVAESEERVEQLNQLLWTYDPGSFLAHGSVKDGQADLQPILLSSSLEPANQANVVAITDGRTLDQLEGFERVMDIFDGNDPQLVEKARNRWSYYKNKGLPLTYQRQTETGGWEQKAAA